MARSSPELYQQLQANPTAKARLVEEMADCIAEAELLERWESAERKKPPGITPRRPRRR
jgi:hypothetical protein